MAAKTQTVTEILTAAGIAKVSDAQIKIYTAMQLGATGTQAEIMDAAGTKDTATRVALAELVTKELVVRTEGTGTGKNRTANTYALATKKKAPKTPKAPKTGAEGTTVTPAASSGPRYGKAMIRVWDFMKAHEGEALKVSDIVKGLAELGENTWYNATNQALRALAARPTGITQVTDADVNTYVYSDSK